VASKAQNSPRTPQSARQPARHTLYHGGFRERDVPRYSASAQPQSYPHRPPGISQHGRDCPGSSAWHRGRAGRSWLDAAARMVSHCSSRTEVEGGFQAMRALLDLPAGERPTAIIAFTTLSRLALCTPCALMACACLKTSRSLAWTTLLSLLTRIRLSQPSVSPNIAWANWPSKLCANARRPAQPRKQLYSPGKPADCPRVHRPCAADKLNSPGLRNWRKHDPTQLTRIVWA